MEEIVVGDRAAAGRAGGAHLLVCGCWILRRAMGAAASPTVEAHYHYILNLFISPSSCSSFAAGARRVISILLPAAV